MDIRYENTFKDMIKFNLFHLPRMRVQQVSWLITIVAIAALLWTIIDSVEILFIAKIIFLVIAESIILAFLAAITFLTIIFAYIPGKNKGILTEHHLKILDTGLVEETSMNTTSHSWAGIVDICQNRDYIFIYVTQHAAHVIPKKAFKSRDEATNFFQYACQLWKPSM
jgi:hypothetical protein